MASNLEFLATDFARTIAWIVAPLMVAVSLVAWKRSGFRPAIFVLEVLRLALVAGVLFALHQPEYVVVEPATELPKIAILRDTSESMQTRDVMPHGVGSAAPLTRADWLEQNLELAALRERLAGRYSVLDRAFSGTTTLAEGPAVAPAVAPEEEAIASTDMAGPLAQLLEDPDLRAVVLLGDGDWNVGGNPADVAMNYRMRGVPIMTTTIGSRVALPDIEFLPLEPPAFALVGKPLVIPYAIRSSMDRDIRVTVRLRDSDGGDISEEVLLAARATFEGNLMLTPRSLGSLTLTANVPVQPGELDPDNNEVEAVIDVREESLRVLLIESYPRWEYRYLRNAMLRDPGVEVDCLLFHPDVKGLGGGPSYLDGFPSREELASYDVVFLGDVGCGPKQLTPKQCEMIRGLVAEQASGLILMPGLAGHQLSLYQTELEPLLPVELDPGAPDGHGSRMPAQLVLTEAGRRSTLTKLAPDERSNTNLWDTLPGFQWHAAVLRARAGSSVLAVHSSRDDGHGRVPLLVTKNFGTGKVLFMGTDGAWRWREGIEDKIHYRFWRQVVRWMAYQRKMNAGDSMRLFYTPDRPGVRTVTSLFANVMDAAGAPLSGANLTARIVSPSGRLTRLEFTPDDGEWGLYRSSYRALEPGEHAITLTCRDIQDELVTTLDVAGAALERVGQPARPDVMAELSRVSGGDVILASDLVKLEERLMALEDAAQVSRRTRLWSHPLLGGVLVLLMAGLWAGRKLVGRF